MTFMDYGLREDPFLLTATSAERQLSMIPFIPTESYQMIENRVFYHFDQPSSSQIPLYLYFVGNIGVGKTTGLLYLKKKLEEKEFNVAYLGSSYNSIPLIYRGITGSFRSYAPLFKEKWDNTRSIIIFDVPDAGNRTHLSEMGSFMQNILVNHLTSIIVTFNRLQYQRFQSLGTILGKFHPYVLNPFTIDETMNMIHKRLERARLKPHKDPLHPFETDIIEKIYNVAQGNTRNILNLCSLLIESGKKKLDVKLLKEVTKRDYVMKVLQQRYQDEHKVGILKQIIDVIADEFGGVAPSQKILTDKIKTLYGWSKITVVKRLKELEKLNLVSIDRNVNEPWRMDHRLVTQII
jgi:predicted AAA+ superfamily ATPase